MPRVRSLRLLSAALAAATFAPPAAMAASGDQVATQAYVHSDLRLVQTGAARIPQGEAAIRKVVAQITRDCPHAAAGSPQDPESTQMSNEVIGAMVTSALHDELPSIREYVRVAGGLHWSNHGLSGVVHAYVGQLRTLASLTPPNVCSDVRSWAASGFRTLPARTVAFDARFVPSWVALGEQPAPLRRYESGEGVSLARRAAQREAELSDFEAREVETWGHIMNVLNLYP